MRLISLALLLGTAALSGAQSLKEDKNPKKENTYFNNIMVPPLLELTPSNWDEEMKLTKFLLVKHYRCVPVPPCHRP
jgi:protein disulfide-isomerase